jgi:hypothetical protein
VTNHYDQHAGPSDKRGGVAATGGAFWRLFQQNRRIDAATVCPNRVAGWSNAEAISTIGWAFWRCRPSLSCPGDVDGNWILSSLTDR